MRHVDSNPTLSAPMGRTVARREPAHKTVDPEAGRPGRTAEASGPENPRRTIRASRPQDPNTNRSSPTNGIAKIRWKRPGSHTTSSRLASYVLPLASCGLNSSSASALRAFFLLCGVTASSKNNHTTRRGAFSYAASPALGKDNIIYSTIYHQRSARFGKLDQLKRSCPVFSPAVIVRDASRIRYEVTTRRQLQALYVTPCNSYKIQLCRIVTCSLPFTTQRGHL
jgi:hypothetical protein